MTTAAAKLEALATEFADELTCLTRGVLGAGIPPFRALNTGSRIRVSPIDDNEKILRIPISVNGEQCLSLMARYFCCSDRSNTFLATHQADIRLFYVGVPDPLLRFEYERDSKEPPGAHVQVHAHRDEIAFLLRLAEAGRPRDGMQSRKLPRLAEMHLPVGGHRMRPALEDVLLFLKREFAIDTVEGWRAVVEKSLREWRVTQVKSAVRDVPEAAVEVLRKLGYTVEPPKVVAQRPAPESVKLFWP
ncbi:hypothetical protein [Streptomyces sp. 8N706]|uniref:hypothetical protein n=1 Tax=Streptomyces sp. 8N706 TaxID=3457416 RepID=UPI003FD27781